MGGGCRVEPVGWRWFWVSDCGALVVLMLEINFLASSFHVSLNWGEGWWRFGLAEVVLMVAMVLEAVVLDCGRVQWAVG